MLTVILTVMVFLIYYLITISFVLLAAELLMLEDVCKYHVVNSVAGLVAELGEENIPQHKAYISKTGHQFKQSFTSEFQFAL